MKRQYIAVILLIILLPVFYFLILPNFDISQFLESLKSTNIFLFSLAVIAVLVSNSFAALRWSLLMKEVNALHSSNFSNAFGIFSLGQIAGLVVPSRVGNYTKIPMVMKLDGLSYESGLAAVNAETILDLAYICFAVVMSLFILSAFLLSNYALSLLLLFFLILFLLGCMVFMYKIDRFNGSYERIRAIGQETSRPYYILLPAQCITKLFEYIQSTRLIFIERKVVIQLIVFTLFFQLLGILGYFLVIQSVNVTLPIHVVFAIVTLSFLVGIISFIPGGLGASDLSLIILLASQGISLPVATNIALLFRIAMYLPIFLVIGVYLIQKKINIANT
jgi:uncharacterized protein (TIRG00374 family)